MRQTLQFIGLMAFGLLAIVATTLVTQSWSGGSLVQADVGRSAFGIDYVSFGIGLAMGLTLAEIARVSWADMPRRAIQWLIANSRNAKYLAYACVWVVVLIYV